MKVEPIEFGVGQLSLERLGIKIPDEISRMRQEEAPEVESPIEEPDMVKPIEPSETFTAETMNDRFKYAAEGFVSDLVGFVSSNYLVLASLALIGYVGYKVGQNKNNPAFESEYYYPYIE